MTDTRQLPINLLMEKPITRNQLLERLSSGFTFQKAGEAHGFLTRIIIECLKNQSETARIICKDIAKEYNVSQPTMCHWNRKLTKNGLVTYKRMNKYVLYTPANFLNTSKIYKNQYAEKFTDHSHALISDLFTRVRALELKVEK